MSKSGDVCKLKDKDTGQSKENMSKNVSAQTEDSHKDGDIADLACRDQKYPRYSSSTQAYSVSEISCKWLKELFPGISLKAGATVRHGGTFSTSVTEKHYEDTIEKTGIFLVDLLERMHDIRFGKGLYSSVGPLPRHLVINHRDVWDELGVRDNGQLKGICYPSDGNGCRPDINLLPPVYRFSLVGGLPTLLVHPATLYELVELIPHKISLKAEYAKKDSQISFTLEHLIQSVAYAKTQDIVRDAHQRTLDACKKELTLQSAGAQADCDAKIAKLSAEKDSLRIRNETDRNHMQAQMQFYSEISRLKASQISIQKDGADPVFDEIQLPSEPR